ncbi:MAG: ATP-binding protein [Candidatus Niyogibacteria bacterium]|nr:ATP-binding protein [Candidatus Niyogibacteria bacterium]
MRTFVITGASSCGKTTLINELAKRGHPVLHEAARELIGEGKLAPRTAAFQNELAARHLAREAVLRETAAPFCFLDRGAYDNSAFCRYFGFSEPEAIAAQSHAYDAVFILDSLGDFQLDGVRIESGLAEALRIKGLIRAEYESRGIPRVTVPAMGVKERADFILEHVHRTTDTARAIGV